MKQLIYDIETLPLRARIWRPGYNMTVRHGQLMHGHDHTEIICIQYCINDGPVKIIKRDLDNIRDQLSMIEEFDEIVQSCDIVIGKNSDRFDNKHINTIRMLEGGKPIPDWIRYTDDLEKQMRKHFNLPSNALDYISHKLGFGGKNVMEFGDWVAIDEYFSLLRLDQDLDEELDWDTLDGICTTLYGKDSEDVIKSGMKALQKMHKYGVKDTADTRSVWNYCKNHFEPKNSPYKGGKKVKSGGTKPAHVHLCLRCGSADIIPDRERADGLTTFYCKSHRGYAGRARKLKKKPGYGKIA